MGLGWMCRHKWLSWEHFSKVCLLEGLPFIPLMIFFSISLWWWPECDQKTAAMQDNIYWNWEYCFFLIFSTMSIDAGLAVLHHQSQHNFSLCLSVIKRFRFFPKFLFPDHLIYLLSKCFFFFTQGFWIHALWMLLGQPRVWQTSPGPE